MGGRDVCVYTVLITILQVRKLVQSNWLLGTQLVGGGVQTWPLTFNHSALLPCIRMSSQPSLEACTPI